MQNQVNITSTKSIYAYEIYLKPNQLKFIVVTVDFQNIFYLKIH